MNKNDILRRLRYTFDLNDKKMIAIFKMGGLETTREKISDWLRKEEDEGFLIIDDVETATFLNGLIIEKRGSKDDELPVPEELITNNLIIRKLKIALNMKDNEILEMMEKEKFKVSRHELSALFRKKGHKHYRECQDQFLRYFLSGLQTKIRPKSEKNNITVSQTK